MTKSPSTRVGTRWRGLSRVQQLPPAPRGSSFWAVSIIGNNSSNHLSTCSAVYCHSRQTSKNSSSTLICNQSKLRWRTSTLV
ncbi:MAG: CxxxxCH/CxxCH domain-containing protein [Desertifilum sp. SIO1I2]|nr:CxxxxCH/CxxCH domain-containing protein [Desertifilum sp. SIO1I2]